MLLSCKPIPDRLGGAKAFHLSAFHGFLQGLLCGLPQLISILAD